MENVSDFSFILNDKRPQGIGIPMLCGLMLLYERLTIFYAFLFCKEKDECYYQYMFRIITENIQKRLPCLTY